QIFDTQLSMAEELNLPVIIHDREAHGPIFDAVKRHPDVIGVMHGYSGSAEMAREYAKLGWYIAFGGPVTYKTAEKVREACRAVPTERLLIETDCPYLPPVPHRGEINLSRNMIHTIKIMAETRGEDVEALAAAMIENTKRLFKIDF
ncbi:MAG: TatD family hydrolase, partial [Clostridia bacterium]|nr:TatD family hydrolase [Clostridia bacterium]